MSLAMFLLRRSVFAAMAFAISAGAAAATDTSRIVSIGGAVTEIIYALGADKNVVAIDTTSVYPPRAAAEKASVGYMRAVSAEGVLGLRPSLILATEGSGPKETMAVLQAAKVPLIKVPDSHTGDGIIEKIQIIAKALNAQARGKCIVDQVRKDLDDLQKVRAGIRAPKRVMFVLSLVNGRAMVSGRNTAADGIITMAGAVNVVTEYEGYKAISDEAVIAAKPDIILAMDRGGPNPVTADHVFGLAAFSGTPAATDRRFIAMDGLYLLGFGPRTARAARDLTLAIYPQLADSRIPKSTEHSECHE
jgi:iron complex transport system substrate-binding protein